MVVESKLLPPISGLHLSQALVHPQAGIWGLVPMAESQREALQGRREEQRVYTMPSKVCVIPFPRPFCPPPSPTQQDLAPD